MLSFYCFLFPCLHSLQLATHSFYGFLSSRFGDFLSTRTVVSRAFKLLNCKQICLALTIWVFPIIARPILLKVEVRSMRTMYRSLHDKSFQPKSAAVFISVWFGILSSTVPSFPRLSGLLGADSPYLFSGVRLPSTPKKPAIIHAQTLVTNILY
jgi:hypothetical protein